MQITHAVLQESGMYVSARLALISATRCDAKRSFLGSSKQWSAVNNLAYDYTLKFMNHPLCSIIYLFPHILCVLKKTRNALSMSVHNIIKDCLRLDQNKVKMLIDLTYFLMQPLSRGWFIKWLRWRNTELNPILKNFDEGNASETTYLWTDSYVKRHCLCETLNFFDDSNFNK